MELIIENGIEIAHNILMDKFYKVPPIPEEEIVDLIDKAEKAINPPINPEGVIEVVEKNDKNDDFEKYVERFVRPGNKEEEKKEDDAVINVLKEHNKKQNSFITAFNFDRYEKLYANLTDSFKPDNQDKPDKDSKMEYSDIVDILFRKKEEFSKMIPPMLRDDFINHSYVAGGAIYCLRNKLQVHDFDFFIDDKDVTTKIRNFFFASFANKRSSTGIDGCYKARYLKKDIVLTDNAITIDNFQIITKFFGAPEEVVSSFDFYHNMAYVKDGIVKCIKPSVYMYLDQNKLVLNRECTRSKYGMLMRVFKFMKRGMEIDNSEIKWLVRQIASSGNATDEDFAAIKLGGMYLNGECVDNMDI